MKSVLTGVTALLLGTTSVLAGGVERAPQSINILFEEGNYAELNFGGAQPDVSGTDTLGYKTDDVTAGYGFFGLGYKHQFNENLSGALIVEQPLGADVNFKSFADGGSLMLGGTSVKVDSTTYTALLRYKFQNNFSIHGGIRGSNVSGDVALDGWGYSSPLTPGMGGVMGYKAVLDDAWAAGWVAGVAYEVPQYHARVSLTFNSSMDHDFDTRESIRGVSLGPTSTTTVTTPESWTLEGQTGVAADTLLFGSIRWVNWSDLKVDPDVFTSLTGEGLVDLEDSTTYTIGMGRKFTENWSGAASFTYEPEEDELVSPLTPTNGRKAISLAAIYTQGPIKVTSAVSYMKLGDAEPETGGVGRAKMDDSELWGVGFKIGYSF